MVPAVRAIADRFIYDTATLKYIAGNCPVDGLERVTPGSGWTVRQVLGHLAETQTRYADTIGRWLADEPALTLPRDPTEANAAAAARNADADVSGIVAALDRSIREIVNASHAIDDARVHGQMSGWDSMRVLNAWASHAQGHVIDLVTALHEFRTDPMVLNWALHFDFSQEPESAQWQRGLARDVHALFQVQGQEEN